MILSDRTIREQLAAGRIVIDPLDERDIQPSSVDLHIDRYFRVFRNHTMRVIDVKEDQEELTELVEINEDDPFILHPGEFVLGSTLERVKLPNDLVARLEGKALALTTEVPTPAGWTTMGEIAPGDQVFSPSGLPTTVVRVSEYMTDRPCYEVLFSDGQSVIADGGHLWATQTKYLRRYALPPRVVTTEHIAATLKMGEEYNHHIPLCSPVQYEGHGLPIDPYVLGVWLGDGTSTTGDITCNDPEILAEIEQAGYSVRALPRRMKYRIGGAPRVRDARTGRYRQNASFHSSLRQYGLLGNKHVPEYYLTAHTSDRLALLQGLMDSDGYCDEYGRCEFVNTKEQLSDAVVELAASLGFRPVKRKKQARLYGVDCGPVYQVKFTTDFPVFRLPRKLARQRVAGRFHRSRSIRAVRPVPSVPVRCIEVEAADGMFLVGRTFIPTHNSSLGRLGLLIHSSLPGSEPIVVLANGKVESRPIEEVVRKKVEGSVVGFDPETFEISYHPITGWYEGPPDRIFEVRLASGRSVRVTAGHNLFTLDSNGELVKTRTAALEAGTLVAIPRRIPDAGLAPPMIRVLEELPEGLTERLVVEGPTVAPAFERAETAELLISAGMKHVDFYRSRSALPLEVARQIPGLVEALGPQDRVRSRGGRNGIPAAFPIDGEIAWLLGIYVAEGYRRRGQVVIANTKTATLDRAAAAFASLGLPVHRADEVAITCTSIVLSELFLSLGMGGHAPTKRMPRSFLGWPQDLQEALLEGMMDGDGSRGADHRDSYWSSSPGLVSDVLLLMERLGRRAAAWHRSRNIAGLFQVGMPRNEHKLLTSIPLPDLLLRALRGAAGLTQLELAKASGFKRATDICNIEKRVGRDAIRRSTLSRLRDGLAQSVDTARLDRLVDGDLTWDRVIEVRDTGDVETIFDIEVRPNGRHIENFLAGSGGVLVSNTAGFVDAGWDGQLTLELSNVANLPITLYPGMKIGQISFLQMTTDAEHPYGSGEVGSKYQHQVGPRPSRYFENFRDRPTT